MAMQPRLWATSTTGAGSDDHLAMLQFQKAVGTEMIHVPYQGGGPAMIAVLGGETELQVGLPVVVVP